MFREINKVLAGYASRVTFGRVNVRSVIPFFRFYFLMHNAQRVLLYSASMHSVSRRLKVHDFSLLLYLRHLFYQEFLNECGRERTGVHLNATVSRSRFTAGFLRRLLPRTTNIIQKPINN